jgi:phosphatidate cytidylyltransferase
VYDGRDSDHSAATPAEGVRILGAEEAQAALAARRGEEPAPPDAAPDETEPDDAAPGETEPDDAAPGETEHARRPVVFPEGGPSWSASAAGDTPAAAPEPADVAPLPHWTEPPTGAVPAIFADDAGEPDTAERDLDAWATISGQQPRFRAGESDWAEADFAADLGGEDEPKFGALSEQGPVDEEAEFAAALAQRRRRPRAARGRAHAPARPRPAVARAPEGEVTPPGPSAARDLPTAILTAAAVVVVALVCFRAGRIWTALLTSVILGVATIELCRSLRTKGMRPATLLAFAASATVPVAAKEYGISAYPLYFGLVAVFSMLWFLWKVTPGRPVLGIATTVLAFAYVGGLGGFAGLLLGAPNGVGLVLGVGICSVAYDVAGFFVGSQFGRQRIAPNISPNKTVAGTVGGMGASVVLGWLATGSIHPWNHTNGFWLGVLVAFAAFLGDLCESMIKRDLGIKDFGSLLPGHGGVLDRFDGLLFSLPVAYYLALHLGIG